MKTIQADVIICGGGTAGLPAALAAARKGLRVVIIEEDSRIGGAPVDMFIQNFCGGPRQGIYKEVHAIMRRYIPQPFNDNLFYHTSYIMAYQELFQNLDIRVCNGQKLISVNHINGMIQSVESANTRYEGKIFIDATGDADIAAQTPCVIRYGRESKYEFNERFAPEAADNKVQRCTLMFTVRRKPDCPHKDRPNWAALTEDEFLIWGPTVICEDTRDEEKVQESLDKAMGMLSQYREQWDEKGFYITAVAPKLGVRESRRIEGNYILSYNDVNNKTSHPDSFCVVSNGIDPWDPEGNPVHSANTVESTVLPDYEIPYRCLVTQKVDNMIVAGRTIASTHVVNSSLRVMPILMITGQAAGNAAALAIKGNVAVSNIDTDTLRTWMKEQGVRVSL